MTQTTLLERPSKSGIAKGGQPFAVVRGVPEKPFSLFLRAAAGGAQRKEEIGARPQTPGQGLPPLTIPLEEREEEI